MNNAYMQKGALFIGGVIAGPWAALEKFTAPPGSVSGGIVDDANKELDAQIEGTINAANIFAGCQKTLTEFVIVWDSYENLEYGGYSIGTRVNDIVLKFDNLELRSVY